MNNPTNGAAPGDSNGFGTFPPPLLTEIQRLGLHSAAEVIKGFTDLLGTEFPPRPAQPGADRGAGPGSEPGPAPEPGSGRPGAREPGFAQLRVNVARALDLYTEVVRRSFEGYADLVEQGVRGVRPSGGDDGPLAPLSVRCASDGAPAAGTVWIHNTTDRPVSITFRLTDLTAHDGAVVAAAGASFEPSAVLAAPDSSVSTRFEIRVNGAAAGVYHGHVMAQGLPEAALPVRLAVTGDASGTPG